MGSPVKRYFRGATTMLDQARKHAAAEEWEQAFVLLMRFVTFFLERMPEHPDYRGKGTASELQTLKREAKDVFGEISMIKKELLARYTHEAKQEEEKEVAAAVAAAPPTPVSMP